MFTNPLPSYTENLTSLMQTGLFDQIIKDNPFCATPLIGFPVNTCLRYNKNKYIVKMDVQKSGDYFL